MSSAEVVASPSLARAVFSRSAFPLVTGGAIALAIHLIGSGIDPIAAMIAAQVPAFGIVIACERIFPYHASWNRSRRDFRVDLSHGITITATGALLQPAILAAGVAVATALSGWIGIGVWPLHWPLLAQLALALVIVELFQYWVHRLQHEREWLWRFHATHHSAPRLYWLNASRFHFGDIALNNFVGHVPLAALGAGADVFALWTLFAAVHGIFQHANLELRLGPLNWIFSMAELHRWHHSRLPEESNRNYGQNLIVWDTLFGTRFLPADREPPEQIGLAPGLEAFPMTFWSQLTSPLRWRRIERESLGLAANR